MLAEVLKESCGGNPTAIVARVLRIRDGDQHLEAWLRVSFDDWSLFDHFERSLFKRKVKSTVVYRGKNNVVLWARYALSTSCRSCLLVSPPSRCMLKTTLVTPVGVIHEILHMNSSIAHNGRKDTMVLISGSIREMMNYMLTPREQEVIYTAYSKGYYESPRETTLQELARELKISVSTLNEVLRSGERKIIEAFIKHDMPHLMFKRILAKAWIEIPQSSTTSSAKSA
ncbi:MAG: helix-turn-helix domain-containing protein [Acidilobaceae archaeon]